MPDKTQDNEIKENETADAVVTGNKPKKTKQEMMELLVVILLGVVTMLTAWAAWIGSLHGGNQAGNYTKSNNLSARGNSEWNEAAQDLQSDMRLWDAINNLRIEYTFAEKHGDKTEMEKCDWKIEQLLEDNASEELVDAIAWADEQEELVTPFDKEGFMEGYFENAQATLDEAQAVLEQGEKDNTNEDSFGLVGVIYSVVLFLLGISSSIESEKNRRILIIISIVGTVLATIYMLTLPMPTGFSLLSFFKK